MIHVKKCPISENRTNMYWYRSKCYFIMYMMKKTPSTWATTFTWKPCLHNHICQLSILSNHIYFTHTFQSSLLSLFLEPFVFLPSDLSVKKLYFANISTVIEIFPERFSSSQHKKVKLKDLLFLHSKVSPEFSLWGKTKGTSTKRESFAYNT